ncbi:MAG: L-threonylcarbamoyladenylate synthase, partial [Pseudomonadota bacterium]
EVVPALRHLLDGGILLYPSDTIWGLGCDPLNDAAVREIYRIKQRPDEKQLLLLSDSVATFQPYVETVPEQALEMIETTERPLTIIYEGARELAPALLGPERTIGIRVTRDPFCAALIGMLGRPLVSTSANISGEAFGGSFSDVAESIREAADYVVQYRQKEEISALPSRIVRMKADGEVQILRA